jgi:enoyl-[acyl-carrier protein] reductase I
VTVRAIDLSGKAALVLGVANQRSLAWAIAESLGEAGCRLAFTYQGERLHENVTKLASKYDDALVMACDVTSDEQLDGVFSQIESTFGRLDILIHSIAFARREDLEGEFRKTTLEGWRIALDISAYSLVALSNRAAKFMEKDGGSIVALTFQASQRVFPNYNVMGSAKAALEHAVRQLAWELGPHNVRVNAVSAGPVSTLSARGISGFTNMISHHRERAPLRRNIEPREVGDTALFLCSPLASGITGTIVYVDAGYHAMGL